MKRNVFRLTFFILGCVIGAGFASGKEIATFFSRFGWFSVLLALLSAYIFYVLCNLFLNASALFQVNHFGDVTKKLFPRNAKMVINIVLTMCFLLVVSSMLAGSNALGLVLFPGYSGNTISLVTAAMAFVVTLGGIRSIHKMNMVLVPVMIIMLVTTCIISCFAVKPVNPIVFEPLEFGDVFMGIGSVILYVCLNMLTESFLLMQIGKQYSKREIKISSIVFSVVVGILILIITIAVINSNFTIFDSEMPIIALAFNIHPVWSYVISAVVWLAIFTTIVSTVYVVATFLKQFVKNYAFGLLLTFVVAFAVSIIGFSNIVTYIYPVMGLLGLLLIVLTIYATARGSGTMQGIFVKKQNR